MAIPVILDCDPGLDDVFAIWLAATHPAIDLRAITTVAGNGIIEHTTRNARIACTVAGIRDIPIAQGAGAPLAQPLRPADWIHGADALGGLVLPTPDVPLDERSALDLACQVLTDSDQPVVIAATGPITNIAKLVQQHPGALEKVARVVWMGGSTTRGNVGPYTEFNASTDPEAVDLVLRSGIPFTMVGLNITHQALITRERRARIRAIGTSTGQFGADLLEYFCSTYDAYGDMPDGPLHDPVTIAMIAEPAVATTVATRVDIELVGEHTRGATAVDLLELHKRPRNATVAIDLDVDRFWTLIEDSVRALD